jgi:hypothetical protein
MSDEAREIKAALCDPRGLCDALGLVGGKGSFISQGQRGITVRCVSHDEKSPSMSVTRGDNSSIRVVCFSCGFKADALGLIAEVRGLSTKRDFKALLIEAAHIAGLASLAYDLESGKPAERPAYVAPVVVPEPERAYPDAESVVALLDACVPVTRDDEVSAYLLGRSLDPELVAESCMAYALPPAAKLPRWARYQGSTWVQTGHRLVLPVRDASGASKSVRAWRVTDGESPKRLPPSGHRATGLVLACPLAVSWLLGQYSAARVLIVEGEPDALRAASWPMQEPTATLGIVSGSWSREWSSKFTAGQRALVFTHRDPAGDKYAAEIVRSLAPRGVVVSRWNPKEAA